MNPVAMLRTVTIDGGPESYEALMVWCPGCAEPFADSGPDEHHSGLHMIPVSGAGRPTWDFDGNLESPTLSPSILSHWDDHKRGRFVCHSFLRAGIWEFLTDSTHPLAGQHVPAVPLPDWVVE